MKKYLMSQYGIYIKKISDRNNWLHVDLIDELRQDREKYVSIQNEIKKTCEKIYKNPLNICVG